VFNSKANCAKNKNLYPFNVFPTYQQISLFAQRITSFLKSPVKFIPVGEDTNRGDKTSSRLPGKISSPSAAKNFLFLVPWLKTRRRRSV